MAATRPQDPRRRVQHDREEEEGETRHQDHRETVEETIPGEGKRHIVYLRSKGPVRKGNPLLKDIDFNSDIIFFSYFQITS